MEWPKLRAKDTQGFDGLEHALALAMRGGEITDAAVHAALMDRVLQSGSVELLEATMSSLVTPDWLRQQGLPEDIRFSRVDSFLFFTAVRIEACMRRRDCEIVGQDNPACVIDNSCIDDLRQLPSERIYGSLDDRANVFKIHPYLSAADLKHRYEQLRKVFARAMPPPAAAPLGK